MPDQSSAQAKNPTEKEKVGHLIIEVHEATDVQDNVFKLIAKILDVKDSGGSVVILSEDQKCADLAQSLEEIRINSCLFVEEMKNSQEIVEKELKRFQPVKVAVCSYEAMRVMKVPFAEKYIFFDMPSRRSNIPRALEKIEKLAEEKNRKPDVEIFLNPNDDDVIIKVVFVEAKERGCIPTWLESVIISKFGTPELRQRYEERKKAEGCNNKSSNTNNPTALKVVPVLNVNQQQTAPTDTAPEPEVTRSRKHSEELRSEGTPKPLPGSHEEMPEQSSSIPTETQKIGRLDIQLHDATDVQKNVFNLVAEILDARDNRGSIVILSEDSRCANLAQSLNRIGLYSSLFVEEINKHEGMIEEELERFKNVNVAVCSYKAMKFVELPLVEKYVFFDLPSRRLHRFERALRKIEILAEEKKRTPQVEIFLNPSDDENTTNAVYVETRDRECEIPHFLGDFIVSTYGTPELQERYFKNRNERMTAMKKPSFADNWDR
ncbi:hypothetical protein B9Z55_026250 [Caenorhabditis nigoni]|nr:hypothetical protein B9Z55_026250 [Caenorhabditis nigoni]